MPRNHVLGVPSEQSTGNGCLFAQGVFLDGLIRYKDLDGNRQIDVATEAFELWNPIGFLDGAIFDFAIDGARGLVPSNEFNDNDQILSLVDLNGDGDFLDAGETQPFLSFDEQGSLPLRPRSIVFYSSVASASVPLPASAFLLGGALGGLGFWCKRHSA